MGRKDSDLMDRALKIGNQILKSIVIKQSKKIDFQKNNKLIKFQFRGKLVNQLNFHQSLLFLLNLYVITNKEKYLNKVITVAEHYFNCIIEHSSEVLFENMPFIYIKIYQLTNNQIYIKKCEEILEKHEFIFHKYENLSFYTSRTLLAYLQLLALLNDKKYLHQINVVILNIITESSYLKNKIYWKKLIYLSPIERKQETLFIRSLFTSLSSIFDNIAFKNFANKILPNDHSSDDLEVLNFKENQVYISAETIEFEKIYETLNQFNFLLVPLNNYDFKHFKIDFPGISINNMEIKDLVLSSDFKKVLIILWDEEPEKLMNYYQSTQKYDVNDEKKSFSNFVKETIQLNPTYAKSLKSSLRLSNMKFQIFKKNIMLSKQLAKKETEKNALLSLPKYKFLTKKMVRSTDVKFIKHHWHGAQKKISLVFDEYLIESDSSLLAIVTDGTNLPKEQIIDPFLNVILRGFRKFNSIKNVISHSLNYIEFHPSQKEKFSQLIERRIKVLISKGLIISN